MRDSKKHLCLTIIVATSIVTAALLITTQIAQADNSVIYVDHDATGAATGLSWTDAYTNVQTALTAADSGDEIWVAEGVYTPTNSTGRDATFYLQSGVELYGGFDGSETSREQRDWQTHVTVLSGDIDGNDTTDSDGVSTDWSHISGNNVCHVVIASSADESGVLDGFSITGGLANTGPGSYSGGGLYNSGGSPTLRNLTFSGNRALETGGGLYNSGGSPTLHTLTFSGNRASYNGGGLYNSGGSPTLHTLTFSGNYASVNGGGLYNNGGSPTLRNLTFSGNHAGENGGGMYNTDGSPTLRDFTFGGNDAENGGGMYNSGGSPTLRDFTFSSNDAQVDGGGMYNTDGSPTLYNVTFSGNRAGDQSGYIGGGGMYAGSGNPTLINVTFNANSSGWYGGGMFDWGGHSTLINVVFSGNSAEDGAGMCNRYSNPVLINVTFSGNSASSSGGGIYIYDSSLALTNCILWGNTAPTAPEMFVAASGNPSASLDYSLVQGGCLYPTVMTCDHLLNTNPQFGSGLRLKDNSPAIDAGDNDAVPRDTYDLDGDGDILDPLPYDRAGDRRLVEHPRSDTGNGDAPLVDMGAFERSVLALGKSADPTVLEPGDPLTYVLTFKNDSTYVVTDVLISDVIPTYLYTLDFDGSGPQITPTGSVSYTWEVADLSAGEGGLITVTGVLSTSLLPGRSFDNVATFSGMAGGVAVDSTARATVARYGADLSVGKRTTRDVAVAGEPLTYTLTITNHGLFVAENVILTDALPSGVTLISASPGCFGTAGSLVTCTLGSLNNQATAAFTIIVTAPVAVGQITNVVTVTAATPDPDPINNTATEITLVSAEADLSIAKSDAPDPVLVGGILTYTLVVTNHGPDIAGGVVVSDALPGVTYAGRLLSLPMNEEAGATQFVDRSGFGHHGSCSQREGTCPESGLSGLYDNVLSFDGEDDWVESGDFDIGNDFTISLWVFPLKHDDGQAFISKNSSSGDDLFIFGYYNGGYQVDLRNASYQAGEKPSGTDLWQHLAVVGRETGPASTEVTVYRNGEILWQHELAAVAGDVSGKGWAIGQAWDGGNESDFFYGAIDEVNVYNRALSASEVAALYGPPTTVFPIASQGTCRLESDGGLMCDLGTLAFSETVTAVFPVRVNIPQPETLTNTATVTSHVPDPTPDNNSDEESTRVGTDLAVGKADDPDPVMPGERLIYTLTITRHNPADIIATHFTDTVANPLNIAIPDPLPMAIPYPSTISVSGLAGTVTKATVTLHNATHDYPNDLDILLVGPGGQNVILMSDAVYFYYGFYSTTVTFDDDAPGFLPASGGQVLSGNYKPTNYGSGDSFESPAPEGPYGSALSVFDGISPNGDWSLYVVDDEPADSEGGIIAGGWSLNLWTGSSGTVTDVLPAGVTFVSASPGCDESGGIVTCHLGVLDDQITTTFTIAVDAPPSVGPITNTVDVVGFPSDLNPGNNTAVESTRVTEADLLVNKTVDTNGRATAPLGSVVTCTLAIRNTGVTTATNVVMTDSLPSGITFRDWVVTNEATVTMQTVEWGPHDVAPNTVYTVSFSADVTTSTNFVGQTIVNTAYAAAANAIPTEDSDSFIAGWLSVYLPLILKN